MELSLEIRFPDGRVEHRTVTEKDALWIGRDQQCHLVLSSAAVSRRHACLRVSAQGLQIMDRSANGTLVDDRPLRQASCTVGHHCELRIGPFVLDVRQSLVGDGSGATGPSGEGPERLSRPVCSEKERTSHPAEHMDTSGPVRETAVATRRHIHRLLLDRLDLAHFDGTGLDPRRLRPQVLAALRSIAEDLADELPRGRALERLIRELCDEALGFGPLEQLLTDAATSEIMVVDPCTIYAERNGRVQSTGLRFTDGESVRAVIERIVTPLGRRIDESTPLVDARLPDGSRVNAVIPPLAVKGPCITIRKFRAEPLTMDRLIGLETLTPAMARFLVHTVQARKNVVISGGTGSGKTTLLNALSAAIPENERIVTIEDAAELQLRQPHVVSLESRPANLEGKGAYEIRDLLKNALRMRPDRIIVGECRGGEAIDMLQAMNTGHEGSMTTTHANSPREAVARLETLCLMSGLDLPVRAIRSQIAFSVHLIVQQSRFSDGTRKVTSIAEVSDLDHDGQLELREIFDFERTGTGPGGQVLGAFRASGYLPSFLDDFIAQGLIQGDDFL